MTRPTQPLGQVEFIALIAMLFATIAFSIDAMLPALPRIAADLSPDAPNRAQLIITSFVMGMGLGTFVAGPLSDSFGRRTVIVAGAILYCGAALAAWAAPSLETVLAARLLQGVGAAGPRVVSLALVRDLYRGRDMARIVSFAMMIFTLVPAVAPALGQVIISGFGWRAVFLTFVVFSSISIFWVLTRQPETLPPENRRPFTAKGLWSALVEVLGHRVIQLSIAAQTMAFAALFATLSSTQPIFDVTFDRADSFPMYFAAIAILAGSASFLNARLVLRVGMRKLVLVTFAVQILLSGASTFLHGLHALPSGLVFPAYFIWTVGVFFMVGMTLGNLNALALEPVGHIAGMAASVMGSVATVASVILAIPVGLMFDGSPVPLMASVTVFAGIGYMIMRRLAPAPSSPL
ncbi:multidrug effflux MFS transporter [Thioclava sp. FR2]|uniref:multidrug effflux MFS transporter n=1 Tax=Thioclava sp. FR2 TaxID=3445780 RepID=UPI003EBC0694